jgi:hypothetical protein
MATITPLPESTVNALVPPGTLKAAADGVRMRAEVMKKLIERGQLTPPNEAKLTDEDLKLTATKAQADLVALDKPAEPEEPTQP